MPINKYREFVLVAGDVKKDTAGLRELTVQVFRTPGVGEGKKEVREVSTELAGELTKYLYRLEHRKLGVKSIITMGEALADLLLPAKSRELFTRSLDKLKPEQGLRLRLRLDPLLADIPWEYIYIQRGEGEKDTTGFLALDPRISIVRHEALPISGEIETTSRSRRVLAAFASPEEPGYDYLDLDQERDNLNEILQDLPGMELDVLVDATVDGLNSKLQDSADIFHFAGHGRYKVTGQGQSLRSVVGEGEIMLVREDGTASPMPADQLAVNLRGHGVQLVVLGACQTGRRDGKNVWSGVVAALMEAEIPAVVAMQFKIWDDTAIAFSRSFYKALAAGFSLDWAVSAGRLAAFNLCHSKRDDAQLRKYWRDWGVPVLYLRSEQTFLLPSITDAKEQKGIENDLSIMVNQRVKKVLGKLIGVDIVTIETGADTGSIPCIGVEQNIGTIEKEGDATAVRIGSIVSNTATDQPATMASPVPANLTCPVCEKSVKADWKFCANCQAPLSRVHRFCTQCGTKIPSGAKFCSQCKAPAS